MDERKKLCGEISVAHQPMCATESEISVVHMSWCAIERGGLVSQAMIGAGPIEMPHFCGTFSMVHHRIKL
jgi:hypothetical protein